MAPYIRFQIPTPFYMRHAAPEVLTFQVQEKHFLDTLLASDKIDHMTKDVITCAAQMLTNIVHKAGITFRKHPHDYDDTMHYFSHIYEQAASSLTPQFQDDGKTIFEYAAPIMTPYLFYSDSNNALGYISFLLSLFTIDHMKGIHGPQPYSGQPLGRYVDVKRDILAETRRSLIKTVSSTLLRDAPQKDILMDVLDRMPAKQILSLETKRWNQKAATEVTNQIKCVSIKLFDITFTTNFRLKNPRRFYDYLMHPSSSFLASTTAVTTLFETFINKRTFSDFSFLVPDTKRSYDGDVMWDGKKLHVYIPEHIQNASHNHIHKVLGRIASKKDIMTNYITFSGSYEPSSQAMIDAANALLAVQTRIHDYLAMLFLITILSDKNAPSPEPDIIRILKDAAAHLITHPPKMHQEKPFKTTSKNLLKESGIDFIRLT